MSAEQGVDPKSAIVIPDHTLLVRTLEMQGLKYVPLENGTVALPYDKFDLFVEFVGGGENEERIVSLRADYHRRYENENVTNVLAVVNDWNLTRRWPRLAVDQAEDGVCVTGDAHMLVGSGVGFLSFLETLSSWMRWAIAAEEYLDSACACSA